MKFLIKMAAACLLTVATTVMAAGAGNSTISKDGDNVTALSDNTQAGAEHYALTLRAPKIDGNVFPVAVHYFDDLVNKISDKRLKATLNVPLTLTITNSRKRRLLTVFSLPGNGAIPYGVNLKKVKQIKVNNYKDRDSKAVVLETFVGPNKKVFRAKANAGTYNIDFILPITRTHFHQGYVQVAVASSNGKELTQLCEITHGDCIKVVKFYVVPRRVEYSVSASDVSVINHDRPAANFAINKTNVDLQFNINNKKAAHVDRKQLPFETKLTYQKRKFNPNLVSKQRGKVYVSNVDIYPVIHYMSNKRYVPTDVVVATIAHDRPDLHVRTRSKDADLTAKLEAMIGGKPVSDVTVEGVKSLISKAKSVLSSVPEGYAWRFTKKYLKASSSLLKKGKIAPAHKQATKALFEANTALAQSKSQWEGFVVK